MGSYVTLRLVRLDVYQGPRAQANVLKKFVLKSQQSTKTLQLQITTTQQYSFP